jgi:hypothetical protein
LPDALVSAKSSNPLELADDFKLSPLASEPATTPALNSGAEAYLRAATAAQTERQASWRERLLALVAEEGPGGVAYSLWFLIVAGMLMGLIVCVVGYSYYQSTKEIDVNKNRATESSRER